jgi:hypothetical protein
MPGTRSFNVWFIGRATLLFRIHLYFSLLTIYFSDPKVLIKVGSAGEIGNVEMQDLLFTTRGATAGLILIEWNIQADAQGSAGLWDCHARVGGATGTELTPAECPPVTSGIDQGCSAASLMMHLTKSASGYFENMWLWGADHMLE